MSSHQQEHHGSMSDTASPSSQAELGDVLAGLKAFLMTEVISRHLANPALNQELYDPRGRLQAEVLQEIRNVREASSAAGFYQMLVPVELGGGGLGHEALFRVWEAIFKTCGTRHWLGHHAVAHWSRGPSRVLLGASVSWRHQKLPALLSGASTMCFAMSEPDAGSDAWQMRTTATALGSVWRIDGTKQWVTNGPYASECLVFAVTDRQAAERHAGGITAFLVPTDAPGFAVDSVIRMWGHAGGDEGILSFSDVEVGSERVVGEVGSGFEIAMHGVSNGRLYNAARSVGLGRWALEKALDYASVRTTFGTPIINNQGISFQLADCAMDLQAARALTIQSARALDTGRGTPMMLATCKAVATEAGLRVLDRSIQIHGAIGLTNELGLGEAWQQIRGLLIADGSSEILRRTIAKELKRNGLHFADD